MPGAVLAARETRACVPTRSTCSEPTTSVSPAARSFFNQLMRGRMMDLLLRVRRTPERLLHPLRRRKALDVLRARRRPKTILVVCHGNICRSPMAAELLGRDLASFGIAVQSAGFIGFNRPAPAEAVAAAQRHSVDLSA